MANLYNTLSIKALTVNYGSFTASAENLNLTHGIHVLIGENGSGKSSVLTGITGYNAQNITARALEINNQPVDKTADYISYLPQQNIPFQITVEDFIVMTAPGKPSQKEVEKVLKKFKLESLKDASADQLSGGEYKRALCAQIHFENKEILMFDEVEQGLDVNYQHLILRWLKELSQTKIIIMGMHDLNLALSYADTITCMKKGTLTAVKVPLELVDDDMMSAAFSREMKVINYEGKRIVIS